MSSKAEKHGKEDHGGGHGGARHGHGGHGHGGHGGHGGSHEEHEGAPEWLISFADNVMLMMGFFVILFALNITADGRQPGGTGDQPVPGEDGWEERVLDFAIGVRKAFHNPVELDSTRPADQPLVDRLKRRDRSGGAATPGTNGEDQSVQSVRPGSYFDEGTIVRFAEGSSTIDDAGRADIRTIAERTRGLTTVIEVRGHASVAEGFRRPEAAMTIAYERAMAVARELAAQGVAWSRIRLVAAGDAERANRHPTNHGEDRVNARVEVVATDLIADGPATEPVAK